LTLKPKGIREPHWHHNAAELDYVLSGRARMTIFGPGNSLDSFEVAPGEIVFIPPAYFHYIENIDTDDDMQFAIFFNHERPEDLGISGSFGAYSNDILASVFGIHSFGFPTKISRRSLYSCRRRSLTLVTAVLFLHSLSL
jgi:oxalate decarboxylase